MASAREVVHVIAGLGTGGAEHYLLTLLARLDRDRFSPRVICFKAPGPLTEPLRALGIPCAHLGLSIANAPNGWRRLREAIGYSKNTLVHCWMYHANLVGAVAARWNGLRRILWSLRQTNLDGAYNRRSTLLWAKAGAILSSRLPRSVVCNSPSSVQSHVKFGYDPARMRVIPNGCDTTTFSPRPDARAFWCRKLAIPPESPLIGHAARWDPVKGHELFLKALAGIKHIPEAHVLFCGPGVTPENTVLQSWARRAGLADRCHFLGEVGDMPGFYSALDVLASPSFGESFPNAVAEAMACGTLCVVTAVGDSADIVGKTGHVVTPGDIESLRAALSQALIQAGQEPPSARLERRQRIVDRFGLDNAVRAYEDLYESLEQ